MCIPWFCQEDCWIAGSETPNLISIWEMNLLHHTECLPTLIFTKRVNRESQERIGYTALTSAVMSTCLWHFKPVFLQGHSTHLPMFWHVTEGRPKGVVVLVYRYWLITRDPVASPEVIAEMEAAGAKLGFDNSVLLNVTQAGCTYAGSKNVTRPTAWPKIRDLVSVL